MPGEPHGQRSLAGYSPCGCKELDMTERVRTYTSYFTVWLYHFYWLTFTLWLLQVMLTETSAYKLLSEYILSVSHGCIPRNGSAELHGNSMFNFYEILPDCFPKRLHHFIFPAAIHRGSVCVCVSCLVSSDSLQHHRLQPTRPLRPWDSLGKNTGVGCHFLLQKEL